jgi:mRNA interferase MazF
MASETDSRPLLRRGDIWWANLDPTKGHEQGGDRPCLILSVDAYTQGPAGMVVVAPVTRRFKEHLAGMHVPIQPPEGGLAEAGVVLCDQLRSIDRRRLRRRGGPVSPATMRSVGDVLPTLLGI